jgi:hypothetical protein
MIRDDMDDRAAGAAMPPLSSIFWIVIGWFLFGSFI